MYRDLRARELQLEGSTSQIELNGDTRARLGERATEDVASEEVEATKDLG